PWVKSEGRRARGRRVTCRVRRSRGRWAWTPRRRRRSRARRRGRGVTRRHPRCLTPPGRREARDCTEEPCNHVTTCGVSDACPWDSIPGARTLWKSICEEEDHGDRGSSATACVRRGAARCAVGPGPDDPARGRGRHPRAPLHVASRGEQHAHLRAEGHYCL